MKTILDFLKRLARHNDREWFQQHKSEYEEVKTKVSNLASQFIEAVAQVDPEAARLRPSDCTYRIYRDVRFSSDKSPYKTHIGIFINPPYGKKGMTAGYYFHIEPGNCFIAAGAACLPSKVVTAIRRSIYDEIDEYRAIVESPDFRRLFPSLGMNPLKTAPAGIARDWEWVEYVRPRDFIAWGDMPEELLSSFDTDATSLSQETASLLEPYIEQMHKYNRFVNFTIEDFIS
ncbi:MAG: DUF2461 domain-containing protein [Bacteroidales bacterium]|nr:DUF2461 domain-containing protein [Bacteroidales bacterium]